MNMPGVRRSRHLNNEQLLVEPQKTWHLVASCKDGLVISLSAQNIENKNENK